MKPGYLQFINGTDRRFQTQAVEWAAFHPDFKRPYYDEEEAKTALPISWPPNVTLLAPEQQASGVVVKVTLLSDAIGYRSALGVPTDACFPWKSCWELAQCLSKPSVLFCSQYMAAGHGLDMPFLQRLNHLTI